MSEDLLITSNFGHATRKPFVEMKIAVIRPCDMDKAEELLR